MGGGGVFRGAPTLPSSPALSLSPLFFSNRGRQRRFLAFQLFSHPLFAMKSAACKNERREFLEEGPRFGAFASP